MTTKTINIKVADPTAPATQPIGWGGYNSGDTASGSFWYKDSNDQWVLQVPSRACSDNWTFGSQGSDGNTPATCTGTDSYIDDPVSLCGDGYYPYRSEAKFVMCSLNSNGGSECNKYTGWPNATNLPKNPSAFMTVVTDNTLYCQQGQAPTPLVPSPSPSTPLVPAETPLTPLVPAETPLTPLVPAETPSTPLVPAETPSTPLVPAETPSTPLVPAPSPSSSKEEEAKAFLEKYWVWFAVGGGVFLLFVVIVILYFALR